MISIILLHPRRVPDMHLPNITLSCEFL